MDAPREPIPMLDLSDEVEELWEELHGAVERVLRSGQFILGPEVEAFEREAAEYLGVEHAIGLNSGTDALVIGLRALGIGPGDEVLTTSYSFFATAEAIGLVGATPVFVDIRLHDFNLDPARLEAAITPRTKAILPVHLFGKPADMDAILEVARPHGLAVLEDCAQSFGARVSFGDSDSRPTGSLGDAAAFSFYPTKNLGAYGDGGMLVTDDDATAHEIRMLRGHGSPPGARYTHRTLGYNSRLDEIQAAILRIKLRRVDDDNARRRAVAAHYARTFADDPRVAVPSAHASHVFHQYAVLVPAGERDRVRRGLADAGIATAAFYPQTLPAAYEAATGTPAKMFPNAEEASARVIHLPIWPGLRGEDVDRIAATFFRILAAGPSGA